MVSVDYALRPGSYFLVSFEVIPCLTATLVEKAPALEIGGLVDQDCGRGELVLELLLTVGGGELLLCACH